MRELFPEEEVCKYMWEHLASTLIGTSPNQTFNMYHGGGQNGKSVLTVFMKMILGDYADIAAPLSLITAERAGIGGVSPEVVKLKGIRYAVVNEPKKNDTINEGVMKQITSGKDALISEFASDRLIRDKTGRLRKTELNSEFTTWFASNYGGKGPSIKDVREYVDKTFGVIKNGIWTGVRVKYEDDDEEDNKEVVVDSDISSEDL